MCAIIGIVSNGRVKDRGSLTVCRDAMLHRGPDDAGEWWSADGTAGLGHRRLSVLDLSPAGHQPMLTPARDLAIVFNGEIYNFNELRQELESKGYRFRSRTDTEVVLCSYQEWGPSCVDRFNGMFAFAIYEATRRRLFLARDRVGEKPLYYWFRDGTMTFASELKALLAAGDISRRVDIGSLNCYLGLGFVPGDRCIIDGIKKLPPAHALIFDADGGSPQIWRYWKMPAPPRSLQMQADKPDALDELDALMQTSVRRRMVADVPVGILLSGGVDSSLVTAMAARAETDVRTYTVRFPGYGQFDETPHARLIAQWYGTRHTELDCGDIGPDILLSLARQFDEPIIDSSMIPTALICRTVRRHCTVALGGDGGDELFGGYSHYSRLMLLQAVAAWTPSQIRAFCARWASTLPVGSKGRNWAQAFGADIGREVPLLACYFDFESRAQLLNERAAPDAEKEWLARLSTSGDLFTRAARTDFENYLPEDILVKIDRASMLYALEVRSPLLDNAVIDFALSQVPSCMKATPRSRKVFLKKLAARVLPPTFDMRRKQGFSIPLTAWLRHGPWRDLFEEILLGGGESVFSKRYVASLFEGLRAGRSNSERLFGLVLFELWRHEYKAMI